MTPRRRSNRQRAAVLAALGREEGFRTAQEIHRSIEGAGDQVGLTTVYRHLQALADAGEVDVMVGAGPSGETSYRACDADEHHHHLVCRDCGHTVEVESPEVESWAKRTAKRHGFIEPSHRLEVFGLCRSCR